MKPNESALSQFWLKKGPSSDIVVSTRIRLARNIAGLPFPHRCTDEEREIASKLIQSFANEVDQKETSCVMLAELDMMHRRYLREQNLITGEMEKNENSFIIINRTEGYTVLAEEEDHVRIQVIRPGLQIFETYKVAEKADRSLNNFVPYAFHDEFGFLTSCISNLGTGLKASVILHLPLLSELNRINNLASDYKNFGYRLDPMVSTEGANSGSLYVLSNRISLGISEIDIIETLDRLAAQIIQMEDHERDRYVQQNRVYCEDRIWRSYAQTEHARLITYSEAMDHLSNIRLGVFLGILHNITMEDLNDIMVRIQHAHLQNEYDTVFRNQEDVDKTRAIFLRSTISGNNGDN